ncbi:MAG: hypothetical protein IPO21_21680 [Bacteroidales bacterium]|nr:hypothetical protein [Bacteroidales bacterium]
MVPDLAVRGLRIKFQTTIIGVDAEDNLNRALGLGINDKKLQLKEALKIT